MKMSVNVQAPTIKALRVQRNVGHHETILSNDRSNVIEEFVVHVPMLVRIVVTFDKDLAALHTSYAVSHPLSRERYITEHVDPIFVGDHFIIPCDQVFSHGVAIAFVPQRANTLAIIASEGCDVVVVEVWVTI